VIQQGLIEIAAGKWARCPSAHADGTRRGTPCRLPSWIIGFLPAAIGSARWLKEQAMTILKWALIFLVVSIIAGLLGFTGISAASADIARVLFYVFVVIFLVLLILGLTIFRA
jgi:uncharacterized membrane protein YtjA (UPF0391 family)